MRVNKNPPDSSLLPVFTKFAPVFYLPDLISNYSICVRSILSADGVTKQSSNIE